MGTRILGAAALALVAACAPPVYLAPKAGTVPLASAAPPGNAAAGKPAPAQPAAPGAPAPAPARAPAPGAPTLAVRLLVDDRPATERTPSSGYVRDGYGWTGDAHTRDDRWRAPVRRLATEALARALAATGRFARVRVVAGAAHPDADYVLTGRLRRLRGWIRYHVVRGSPARVLERLGDAFVDRVEIVDRRTGRLAFVGEAGALLDDRAPGVDPYAAARLAFRRAVAGLVRRVAAADLAHADLRRRVHLDAGARGDARGLLGALPPGWHGRRLDPGLPPGWTGAPACARLRLEDGTRRFYNPSLGTYAPRIDLWRCPAAFRGHTQLSAPHAPEYPAELLGVGPGGPWLVRALGETSWPRARPQLRRYLGLAAPPPGLPVLRLPLQGRTGGAPRR